MLDTILFAVVAVLVLMALRVPVFIAILAGSVVYFFANDTIPTVIIAQRVITGTESIPLLAVPFFVCAGVFMNYSGVTERVMDFCEVLIGRMAGGLAQVNVLLSTLMGGLSGSNLADAAMEAKMLVPEMERKGFSKPFSTVVTAASSIITPLIPPGIAMIIYGSIANVSIGKLFIAGIGPGLLLCLSMMALVFWIAKKRAYRPTRQHLPTSRELFAALRRALLPLCLPVIIIGGIRLGVFTPTEAGAVAIIYSILLGLVYRELTLGKIIQGIKETIYTTSAIMLIVGAASALAWIFTREQVPQHITALLVDSIGNKYLFLLAVNILLLVIGMFVEGTAAMIVLVPLLAPAAAAYGINEIQFAMVVIFNFAVGCLSPPMGSLMFVTCTITDCKINAFIKEAIPFYVLLFGCLLLLTFCSPFSLFLVNLFY